MERYIAVVNNLNLENNDYLPEWMWSEELIPSKHIKKIYKYKLSIGDKDNQHEIFAICYVFCDLETKTKRYFYQRFDSIERRDETFKDCKLNLGISFWEGGRCNG